MLTNFIRKFRLSRAFKKLAREIVQLKRELLLELLEKTPTERSLVSGSMAIRLLGTSLNWSHIFIACPGMKSYVPSVWASTYSVIASPMGISSPGMSRSTITPGYSESFLS